MLNYVMFNTATAAMKHVVPHGLVVRIPAFHVGGPGSIPGVGTYNFEKLHLRIMF